MSSSKHLGADWQAAKVNVDLLHALLDKIAEEMYVATGLPKPACLIFLVLLTK